MPKDIKIGDGDFQLCLKVFDFIWNDPYNIIEKVCKQSKFSI